MTVFARWLLNEASSGTGPVNFIDDTGNGNTLGIDYTDGGTWTNIGAGNGFNFNHTIVTIGAANANLGDIATNGNIGTTLNAATSLGISIVLDITEAHTWGARVFQIGLPAGNGDLALVVKPGNILELRFDDDAGGGIATCNHGAGAQIITINVDTTQATATDRVQFYINGSQETTDSCTIPQNHTLANINQTDRDICVGDRLGGSRNFRGSIYYLEFNDTVYSAQDITDINTALSADNDADWVYSPPARAIVNVDTDNDVYAGQTFTISATALDANPVNKSVDFGGLVLNINSWTEVSEGNVEISVDMPLHPNLEHGVAHTVTVTDDTGALVFGTPVMLSLNAAWETVSLDAVPGAETRSFYHEAITTLGFTADVGDILFLESHAAQTIDGEWSPTIDPPQTVTGSAKFWDVSAGTFTALFSYTWTDGGLFADGSAPVITLLGDNPLTWPHGSAFIEPGYTATDDTDDDVSGNVNVTGSVNTNAVGSYVLSYDVTDSSGNAATQVQRTVHVRDQDAPVITLLGDSVVNVVIGGTYTDAGATATDAVDGDLTDQISVGGDVVDVFTAGTYTITYDVSDVAGNNATQVTRTVIVAADTSIPVITLVGSASITHPQGQPYTDAGATATDAEDGNLTSSIVTTGASFDVNTTGVYTIRYNVSDAAGNTAVEVTRSVTVTDQTAPVITLINGPMSISQGNTFSDPGATAVDNNDGDITANIVVGGDVVDTNTPGSYVVTYDVTDAAGNAATQVTRTVTVNPVVPVTQEYHPRLLSLDANRLTIFKNRGNRVVVNIAHDGQALPLDSFTRFELAGLTTEPLDSSVNSSAFILGDDIGELIMDLGNLSNLVNSSTAKTTLVAYNAQEPEGVVLWHPTLDNAKLTFTILAA